MRISDWSSDVCSSDLGTVRTFRKETQDQLEQDLERIARGICDSQGATMTLRYERRYPALVNSEVETGIAAADAARVVGEDKVILGADALMGSEDFAYMLQARPGCYIWIGNGTERLAEHKEESQSHMRFS